MTQALAAEEYRRGRLTKPDLRRLLGFETGDQVDEFLKEHEVFSAAARRGMVNLVQCPRNGWTIVSGENAA